MLASPQLPIALGRCIGVIGGALPITQASDTTSISVKLQFGDFYRDETATCMHGTVFLSLGLGIQCGSSST